VNELAAIGVVYLTIGLGVSLVGFVSDLRAGRTKGVGPLTLEFVAVVFGWILLVAIGLVIDFRRSSNRSKRGRSGSSGED